MPESSDEPIRRETFQKPGRQECADWEAQLNQAILATDIREGWEGFVDLFDRFYDEEVMVVTGYEGAGVSGQGANRERLLQVLVPLHVVCGTGCGADRAIRAERVRRGREWRDSIYVAP